MKLYTKIFRKVSGIDYDNDYELIIKIMMSFKRINAEHLLSTAGASAILDFTTRSYSIFERIDTNRYATMFVDISRTIDIYIFI